MADFGTILQSIRTANTKWLGFRYIVISVPSPGNSGLTTLGVPTNLAISAAGIQEIVFPTVTADLFKIPQLSEVEKYIPYKKTFGELVLRAPTVRDTSLWDRMKLQLNSFSQPDIYTAVPETLVIGEFETKSIIDLVPIAIWVAKGCQAKAFTPAGANSQGTGTIPLEELRLQVDSLDRASSL